MNLWELLTKACVIFLKLHPEKPYLSQHTLAFPKLSAAGARLHETRRTEWPDSQVGSDDVLLLLVNVTDPTLPGSHEVITVALISGR